MAMPSTTCDNSAATRRWGLTCNAGSSSLKVSLFDARAVQPLAVATVDRSLQPAQLKIESIGRPERIQHLSSDSEYAIRDALRGLLASIVSQPVALNDIDAVGHRVVHGGDRLTQPVEITPDVLRDIQDVSTLAPLHNEPSLQVIAAMQELLPRARHVAVFDTAFHSSLSPAAYTYAIPRDWSREWGLRRFGFHGLSHAYCAGRAAELLNRDDLRLIVAHLGNGASLSAVRGRTCVDTTMGFTPMEGLMMGTRSGSVDPGLLLHLLRHKQMSAEQLDHALNHQSGLLGVSGISSDMRRVLADCQHDPDARLAVDIYLHRVRQSIGAMAASLGGLDALVFTAGIGQHSSAIRAQVCAPLAFLGIRVDEAANATCTADADVSHPDALARVLVVETREDLVILKAMRQLLRPTRANTC